ncbi:MAG: hypothetical protein IJB79_07310 [Candidatus Gastranaerophilales bacterium]|nr:hypothetical protein [Candidatus Gastranaerophilales bacterium]
MEKLLQNYDITQIEMLSYFSCEIFCLIGVVINICLFMFVSKKYNIKRLSDLSTFSVLAVNSLISLGIFLKNKISFGDMSFSLFEGNIVFVNENIFLKFLIYTFFALFVLCSYKITSKAYFKGALANCYLLVLAFSSSILMQVENGILAFFVLDLCALLIYKFASSLRLRKYETYCPDFVLMSATSTILFYSFCLLSFFVKEELQLAVIQVCIVISLLLKSGLFPIYNYSLNKNTKSNLAYSMLLFGFLPYMGVITFVKFMQGINFSNEIFFITISVFVLFLIITSSINAFKAKNVVKFVANCSLAFCGFYLISFLTLQDKILCTKTVFMAMFLIFALFSLLAILKINLKPEKMTILLLQNLFIKNRFYCFLFAFSLLVMMNIIPSAAFFNNIILLKEIYLFDKAGSFAIICLLASFVLIVLKALKIIKISYSRNPLAQVSKLTKRTTPNYVVPVAIILILIILAIL